MIKELKDLLTIIKNRTVIFTILIIFIGSLPAIFDVYLLDANFYNQLLACFTSNFHITMLFLLVFLNIISLSKQYKISAFILKYKNYQTYLKGILKKCLLYLNLTLIISLILCLFFAWVSVDYKITIIPFQLYNISNLEYLIFYMIRVLIYLNLLTMIFFYCNQRFGTKITFLLLLFLILGEFMPIFPFNSSTGIIPKAFFIFNFFKITPYSTFLLEITASFIQLLLLIGIFFLMRYLAIFKRKENL